MKLPDQYKLNKPAHDKLYELTRWYQTTPESIKGQLSNEMDIERVISEMKLSLLEQVSDHVSNEFGMIDTEIVDGLLFAVCRDYDGVWDKDMFIQLVEVKK